MFSGAETIKTNNVVLSPYTQTPPTPTPTPVSGGLFAANQVWSEFNGGSLVYGTIVSGSADLASSPIDGQNSSTSSGTVAVSTPIMNGNVATYTATVTLPLSVNETLDSSSYTAQIVATGTLQSSGTFQFDFSPRTVFWNASSGDFSAGGNWDVGFAPRTVDTAAIQNGGASTLSTAFSGSPAAVWVGDGASTSGTLTLAAGGSLSCGAMVLGQSGGSGTLVLGGGTLSAPSIAQGAGGSGSLYFAGGTLQPTGSNSQFLTGLSAAYVSTGGATINTNGFAVAINQALGHDPALGATADGGLLKTGSGSLTLGGANTYTGGTTITAGTLKAGAANTLSPNSAVTISGGTLDVTGFAQTVNSLTVGSLGSLNLTIGNLLTSSGPASLSGSLNLFGSSGGTADLMNYLSYSGSFSGVSGIPPGYTLQYTSNQLDLIAAVQGNNSVLGASTSSVALGRVMLNYVPATDVTISLTSGTSATGFSISTAGGATASASNNGPGALTPAGSAAVSVGLTNATGSYSGTVQVQNLGDDGLGGGPSSAGPGEGNAQSPISIGVSGTVVDNRVVTASSVNFGLVHVGAAVGQSITLSTSGDDNHFTRVSVGNAGPDANGISVTGGTNPPFNGSSVTDQRTLSGILSTVGAVNGLITLPTTGEGLNGEAPVNVPVSYAAQVFSGKAQWNLAGSGSWGPAGNWMDTQAGGPAAGAPGISGFAGDTATFGNSTGGSAATVTLDGVSPTVSAMTFSNTSGGSFTLTQGSGGTLSLANGPGTASVTVAAGSQTIALPLVLDSGTSVMVNDAGDMLTVSGSVGGPGGLTKGGAGTLVLSGTGSYSGGTVVTAGQLVVMNSEALADGTSLTVGAGGTAVFQFAAAAASPQVSSAASPVPEPRALVLLAVGGIGLLGFARRWRIKNG